VPGQLGNSYLDLNELRARSLVHAERLAARADAAVRVGVMHGPGVLIVHRSALRQELDAVRERGIARERDEAVLGESSFAAPIFDHSGHAVGAIGVVGDTERIMARGADKRLTSAVVEAARGVSRELGASRWPAPSPGS
jgi:DNA-binding IclR family transcriptional regulator